jgi:hypothetical protein
VVYTDASTNHNTINDMSCGEDPHSADEALTAKVDDNELGLVKQYFKKYKETIRNFSKIDQILKQKHTGKIKPTKRFHDKNSKQNNQP